MAPPTVVLTRADNRSMAGLLTARGARCIDYPTIAYQPLASEVAGLYDWLVVTSPRAVQFTDLSKVRPLHVASVGPATTKALVSAGFQVDIYPEPTRNDAEGLLAVFPAGEGTVLLPRSKIGRALLPAGLREKGWSVTEVATYTTVLGPGAPVDLSGADVVCFTSSSTVRGYLALAGLPPAGAKIASIGPVTTATAEKLGLVVHIQPEVATVPALVDAVMTHFQGE